MVNRLKIFFQKVKREMTIARFINTISLFLILSMISALAILYNAKYVYFHNACHMAHKMVAYAENTSNMFFVDRYMSDMYENGCHRIYNLKGIELDKKTDIPTDFQVFSLSVSLALTVLSLLIYYHVAFKKDKQQALWKERFDLLLDFIDSISHNKEKMFQIKHNTVNVDFSTEYLIRVIIFERNILLDSVKFLDAYLDKLDILFSNDNIEDFSINYENINKELDCHTNACNEILKIVNSENKIDYSLIQSQIDNKSYNWMNIHIIYEIIIYDIKYLADKMK